MSVYMCVVRACVHACLRMHHVSTGGKPGCVCVDWTSCCVSRGEWWVVIYTAC